MLQRNARNRGIFKPQLPNQRQINRRRHITSALPRNPGPPSLTKHDRARFERPQLKSHPRPSAVVIELLSLGNFPRLQIPKFRQLPPDAKSSLQLLRLRARIRQKIVIPIRRAPMHKRHVLASLCESDIRRMRHQPAQQSRPFVSRENRLARPEYFRDQFAHFSRILLAILHAVRPIRHPARRDHSPALPRKLRNLARRFHIHSSQVRQHQHGVIAIAHLEPPILHAHIAKREKHPRHQSTARW